MTASEAREAAVRLVRQGRATGHDVTAADVQRVTGRGPRQSRRLLALAVEAADSGHAEARWPWVVEADG